MYLRRCRYGNGRAVSGPEGTAALAVVAPVWNIIYSFGLLMGIGGSVIFSTKRAGAGNGEGKENSYFTSAVIGSVFLAVFAWIGYIFFEDSVLAFFGADKSLLALAKIYMYPIKFVFPVFLFNQMIAAFLRNDNDPGLATLECFPEEYSTFSAITFLCLPAIWAYSAQDWQRLSARVFLLLSCSRIFSNLQIRFVL